MFEAAELGRKISKDDYESQLPELRLQLIQAQFELKETQSPVIIIISGVDGAGKGEFVNHLNQWLDPRGVTTHAFWQSSPRSTSAFPPYWRFWRALPSRGKIGLLFGAWYTDPMLQCVHGSLKPSEFETSLNRISFFEQMLAEDNALIIKLWFHLSQQEQAKRLETLAKNNRLHWRVIPKGEKLETLYPRFAKVSEKAIRETDSARTPWHIIEATNPRYRDLAAAKIILESIERRLKEPLPPDPTKPAPLLKTSKKKSNAQTTILDQIPSDLSLSKKQYQQTLSKLQNKLHQLAWKAYETKTSIIWVFEGWDAAGKGGAIRRVTEAIDPRLYQVIPIAAPSDEEKAHHYLWRFWRHLPEPGRITIFDRSWYGRVLVERVENFATFPEWNRAFREINEFEQELHEEHLVLLKFWIHIDKDEQLKRFEHREQTPYKQFKITAEDWRNREKWDAYKDAVNDMIEHTSTGSSPWSIIPGNCKRYARIQILKDSIDRIEKALAKKKNSTR